MDQIFIFKASFHQGRMEWDGARVVIVNRYHDGSENGPSVVIRPTGDQPREVPDEWLAYDDELTPA